MRRALLLPVVLLACAACAEEKTQPANRPSITSGVMECVPIGGGASESFRLDRVEIIALDLDGVDDLRDPIVWVGSTPLPVTAEDIPKQGTEPLGCKQDSCERMWSWERGPDTAQIYCGTDGTLLDAFVEVRDTKGFLVRKILESTSI